MTAFGLPDDGDQRPFLGVQYKDYASTRPDKVIVLDRIEPGVPPTSLPYCTHGRATCAYCNEWCWLGHKSHDVVAAGEAMPMCKECAERYVPKEVKRLGNVGDHLRADGPH